MSTKLQLFVTSYELSDRTYVVRAMSETGQIMVEISLPDEDEAIARVLGFISDRGWEVCGDVLHLPIRTRRVA